MESVNFLRNWRKDEIYEILCQSSATRNRDGSLSVNSIFKALDYSLLLEEFTSCNLYEQLVDGVGVSKADEAIIYLLENDPSRSFPKVKSIEACFQEKPFPRYLVSICYALLYRTCVKDCSQELGEAIWSNVSETGNFLSYPGAMFVLLKDYFNNDELCRRATELVAADRKISNLVGDMVLYNLIFEESFSHERILKSISDRLSVERKDSKRKKYKKYLMAHSKYTIVRLTSKLMSLISSMRSP